MFRKYVLGVLAAAGIVFAVCMSIAGNKVLPAAPAVSEPSESPFQDTVAGAGILEANTRNIQVGTLVAGVVTEIKVKVGDAVNVGDELFKIDDRDLQADLSVKQAALRSAQEKLLRLKAQPRPEDVPPAEARLKEAQAVLADLSDQLRQAQAVADARAISQDQLSRRRFAVMASEARLAQAAADLASLKAGAWKPDIEIAAADVASAEAQVKAAEVELERLTVRALVTGRVLQVNIRPGEFAQTGALETPLMLLGNVKPLFVRVDVDEDDAWRVNPNAKAIGYLRGNRELQTPLKFAYIEPYVIPKQSLTGDTTERVDTRVLQVVYSVENARLPIYAGQQLDVFIDASRVKNDVEVAEENNDRSQPAPSALAPGPGAPAPVQSSR